MTCFERPYLLIRPVIVYNMLDHHRVGGSWLLLKSKTYLGLQEEEEEPRTAHLMSLPLVSHIATSNLMV